MHIWGAWGYCASWVSQINYLETLLQNINAASLFAVAPLQHKQAAPDTGKHTQGQLA